MINSRGSGARGAVCEVLVSDVVRWCVGHQFL